MSQKSLWFTAFLSYFLGLISIPLSFVVIGIIPAVLGCSSSYAMYKNGLRLLSLPGFILAGLGLLHCLIIFIFTIYTGLMYGSEDPLHIRWKGVQLNAFSINTPDGEIVDFEDFRKQRVVIAYWASWCAPCVSKIPDLNSLNSNSNVTVIGVSSEDMNVIKHSREKFSIRYAVGKLNNQVKPFSEVTRLPTLFFIDRRGVIQNVKVGLLEYSEIKKLALNSDYNGEIYKDPKELFNGVEFLLNCWNIVFSRLGIKL